MEEEVFALDVLKQLIFDQNLKKLAFWYSRDNLLDKILATDIELLSFLFKISNTNTCAKTMIGYLLFKGILLKKDNDKAFKWFIDPITHEHNDYIAQFFASIIGGDYKTAKDSTQYNFGRAWCYEGIVCTDGLSNNSSPRNIGYVINCFKKAIAHGSQSAYHFLGNIYIKYTKKWYLAYGCFSKSLEKKDLVEFVDMVKKLSDKEILSIFEKNDRLRKHISDLQIKNE